MRGEMQHTLIQSICEEAAADKYVNRLPYTMVLLEL